LPVLLRYLVAGLDVEAVALGLLLGLGDYRVLGLAKLISSAGSQA
jgi:hypothetical protein